MYAIIWRVLKLREALNTYAAQLRVSKEPLDKETFDEDYLSNDEWEALEVIRDQLEPLFRLTKDREGNANLKDGACQASHGSLWELLLAFEFILRHFEGLETQSKAGDFNDYPGIQSSITLAWTKAKLYYGTTRVANSIT